MTFAVKRVREDIAQLSLIALIAILAVVGIGGIDAVAGRMLASGASRMLASAEPDARSIRVVANAAVDAEAQDAAVRGAVAAAFDGIGIEVSRQSVDDGASKVAWEIAPGRIGDLDEIPVLQRALVALDDLPDAVDPQRQQNTRIVGGLGDTVQRQAVAVAATRGLLIAPQLIIALLGALVLGAVLSALSASRGEELALMRARGASLRRLIWTAAGESACFVAAGAILACAVLALTAGLTAVALLTGVGAVAFVCLASGLFILRRVGGAGVGRADALRSDAGSLPLPALILPACIAVGLAALASWQLFATGSVLRDGGAADPLAAAAPALLLVAACMIAPVAAGPIAALGERLLRRSRRSSPILPLRQVARRMGGVAVAILCLALAAASVAVAAAAPGARDAAEQRTRLALLGGDVRMISADGLEVSAATAVTWGGVTSAAEVLRTPIEVGSDTVELLVGPPRALGLEEVRAADADTGESAIPAAITRSLADRLNARAGTTLTTRIRSVAGVVPLAVTRIVDAIPGVGDGWGIATSTEAFAAAGADLPVDELWLRSETPAATATQLRANLTRPARILTAAQVSAAPVTSVAPALLTAGSLAAAALGAIGFLSASSAAARARRGESLVLHALGLRPARRRAMRIGENAWVGVYAVLAGVILGAVVAMTVLPVVLGAGS